MSVQKHLRILYMKQWFSGGYTVCCFLKIWNGLRVIISRITVKTSLYLNLNLRLKIFYLIKNTFNIGSLSSLNPCLVQNHEKTRRFLKSELLMLLSELSTFTRQLSQIYDNISVLRPCSNTITQFYLPCSTSFSRLKYL